MAHKTLVGGTAYEIGGGKDLIGSTVYEKDHGKTLVGGTAYEVGFGITGPTVIITKSGVLTAPSRGNVIIDGVVYSDMTSIVVPLGAVIVCEAGGAYISPYGQFGGDIKLNGTTVVPFVNGVYPTTYEYTVNNHIVVNFSNIGSPSGIYTSALLTEIPEGLMAIAISGVGHANYCYITMNGTKYYAGTALAATIGTQITCFVRDDLGSNGRIFLNGNEILRDTDGSGVSYDYVVNGNVLIQQSYENKRGDIYITEL